jgi:hypothetical protein
MKILYTRTLFISIFIIIISLIIARDRETKIPEFKPNHTQIPVQEFKNTEPINPLPKYEVMGFYSPFERSISYDGSPLYHYVCDTFVLIDENNVVAQEMRKLIDDGNTLNTLTSDGNLQININLIYIDPSFKKEIKESSKEKPLSLFMSIPPEDGKGGHPCSSLVNIVSKK